MAGQIVCPRCGARDSFIKGYLPETCLCRVCQSQLDWREIPDCGPDCRPAGGAAETAAAEAAGRSAAAAPEAASTSKATGVATDENTSGADPASGI